MPQLPRMSWETAAGSVAGAMSVTVVEARWSQPFRVTMAERLSPLDIARVAAAQANP